MARLTLIEALELVLELAEDNALDKRGAEDLGQPEEYDKQQCAIGIVWALHGVLSDSGTTSTPPMVNLVTAIANSSLSLIHPGKED
jgi:hypothetical protein